jgi:hypothetical protein
VYDVSPRYGGCRFREHARIGAAPMVHLERARETGPTANPPPPALYAARDRKLIGMLTGGGGQEGGAAAGCLTKIIKKSVKTSFFEVMSEVQKDSEDVSAGIGIFLKLSYLISFPAI